MTIEQHIWAMTEEGEPIIIYTLTNAVGSQVCLTNLGAAIHKVAFADAEGKIEDVVLGYKNPLDYFGDGPACGKCVGRVANRIADGRMVVDGKEYLLERNNYPNHLHGGSKGYANRLWESRVEGNRVVFSLNSADGDCGYPAEVNVEAIYDFDDENSLELTLLARSNGTTPVVLTNHTYWNLNGENSGSVLDHTLTLNCHKALEMNSVQIPTGKLLDVIGTPQDFTTGREFRTDIDSTFNHIHDFKGYDHYFVKDNFKKNILTQLAVLRSNSSRRQVEILTSAEGAMVYTGNWLAGSPTTISGGKYEDYDGVAIECQAYPDAVNQPSFPSVLLHEGELYCNKIVFRLGTF